MAGESRGAIIGGDRDERIFSLDGGIARVAGQREKLTFQIVVFSVRNFGRRVAMIQLVVPLDFRTKKCDAFNLFDWSRLGGSDCRS
jgi:hypothetical protein